MTKWLFIAWLLLPFPALAAPLIADLSNYRIDMDSSFNGTRMFLFGARSDTGDIVAVIRGPQKNYIVRKKEEYGGIWVNRAHMSFTDVPDFYVLASSRPLSEINQAALFKKLGLGEQTLLSPPENPRAARHFTDFSEAFLRYQHQRRLYFTESENLHFMGETLFKSTIEFPDNIPPGGYTAEIYLINDGEVTGMQSIPISVDKTGLDAFLFNAAHRLPLLYGISAAVMAAGVGLLAGRIFKNS